MKTDALSDVYTNRDFAKVFAAIKKVEQYLQPMFDAAPRNLLEKPPNQRMGRFIARQIRELRKQGSSIKEIADHLGVATSTVSDHLKRAAPNDPSP